MNSPLSNLNDEWFDNVNPASPSNVPWDWEVSQTTETEAHTLAAIKVGTTPWAHSGIGRDSVTAWWTEPERSLPPTSSAPGNGIPGQTQTNQYGPMTIGGGLNSVEQNALVGGRIRFKSFQDDHSGDVGNEDFLSEIAAMAAAGNVNVPSNAQVAQAILLGRMNGTA